MPVFPTPEPITIALDLVIGRVHVVASDRSDTTVEVRPADPDKKADVRAADDVRVDFSGGVVTLHAPKGLARRLVGPNTEQVDIEIAVPTGSAVRGEATAATLFAEGRLGGCSFRTGAGDIRLENVGRLNARTGAGSIAIDSITGEAEITNAAGSIRVGRVDGEATVKSSSGSVTLGTVSGSLTVKGSYGDIAIDRTLDAADVKSAYGDIRIDSIEGGEVRLENGYGAIEVGVPEGVAAWLDVSSQHGPVRNQLDAVGSPADTDRTAQITARNNWGAVVIRRPLH